MRKIFPVRVDRGIDGEETSVAAVSERCRGDNALGGIARGSLIGLRALMVKVSSRQSQMDAKARRVDDAGGMCSQLRSEDSRGFPSVHVEKG